VKDESKLKSDKRKHERYKSTGRISRSKNREASGTKIKAEPIEI